MPINHVIINAVDLARSTDFYTTHLDAQLVEATEERVVLDLVTAMIELRTPTAPGVASTWVPDDQQRGFRHVGFKVDRVDPRATALKQAGVSFHLDPLDAEGAVRICFFYDPDGTLLELVEGDLQYTEEVDPAGVVDERALGVPGRPRLDHVALTVADRDATERFYAPLGFSLIGTLEQPHDPRGFRIGYLRSGPTVLEVFTYEAGTRARDPQPDAPGYGWAELAGAWPAGARAVENGALAGRGSTLLVDADGFVLTTEDGGPT